MPNTLAHLGAQGLLVRVWPRDVSTRWVALGCVLPDVPWIGNRILLAGLPGIDADELRLYVIAQSSLLCLVLLCFALAMFARRWRPVAAVLVASGVVHLVLDAAQTKWGNGLHLIAPWSWRPWNFELFWPESLPTYVLTALGLVFGGWALRASLRQPLRAVRPPPPRVAIALLLFLAYLTLPAWLRGGPERADSHSFRTLRERDARPGRRVALDRVWMREDEGASALITLGRGEEIVVTGRTLGHSGRVSVRGHFADAGTLVAEDIHEHHFPRDLASYLGLSLVALVWAAGFLRLPPIGRARATTPQLDREESS
jgi:hypothetical protein